jgi:hypothetical protein
MKAIQFIKTHRAQHYNPAHTHRTDTVPTTYCEETQTSLGCRTRSIEKIAITFKNYLNISVLTLTRQHMLVILMKHYYKKKNIVTFDGIQS